MFVSLLYNSLWRGEINVRNIKAETLAEAYISNNVLTSRKFLYYKHTNKNINIFILQLGIYKVPIVFHPQFGFHPWT
jgi:hypothetical protein